MPQRMGDQRQVAQVSRSRESIISCCSNSRPTSQGSKCIPIAFLSWILYIYSAMLLVIKFRLIICKFLWARQFYLSVRPSSVCLYIASFANLFPFRSCVDPFPDVCSPPIRRLLVLVSSFSSPKTTASSLSLPPFLHPSLHSFKCPIPFIALSTRDIECERSAGEGDDDDDDGKSAVDTNCSSISSRVRLLSRKQILSIRQSVGLNLSRTIDLRPIVGLRPRDRSVRGSLSIVCSLSRVD